MHLVYWQLVRKAGEAEVTLGGNFTLAFRLIDGRWWILHDHTSKSLAETPPKL